MNRSVRSLWIAGAMCLCCAWTTTAGERSAQAQRSVDQLIATAETLSAEEMSSIAHHFDAPEYLVVGGHIGGITLVGGKGDLMRIGAGFGQTIEPEQTVKVGIYWNHSADPVFIRVSRDTELTSVPSGAFVVVGDIISDNQVFPSKPSGPGHAAIQSVSGSCGAGYYACCTATGGSSYKARCRASGTPDGDCVSGGQGATDCSIGND